MLQITVIAQHFVQPSTYISRGNTQPQVPNTPDFVQLTILKFLYTIVDHFGCHFGYYSLGWIWNMNVLCKLTIVILHLPSRCRMAKGVSSNIEEVNTVPSHCGNLLTIALWQFASDSVHIEQPHVLMNGEEPDDKEYQWFKDWQSPQFHWVYTITIHTHV